MVDHQHEVKIRQTTLFTADRKHYVEYLAYNMGTPPYLNSRNKSFQYPAVGWESAQAAYLDTVLPMF